LAIKLQVPAENSNQAADSLACMSEWTERRWPAVPCQYFLTNPA